MATAKIGTLRTEPHAWSLRLTSKHHLSPLPIDEVIPEALAHLSTTPRLVLEAPPGAGKTTRLPWAIAEDAAWCSRQVLVTEPRRIAARLAARRVSEERGVKLGGPVGYRVRFEDVTGQSTRVVYLTEGLLLRRLATDPTLKGVDCVVLDELHERSLDLDLCLALLERVQRTQRPDLRIVAMSATLEGEHVAAYLGDCPRIRSEGRQYEVSIEHLARPDDRPLELQVRSALRELSARDGDFLVFLPGAGEIRRTERALAERSDLGPVDVVPLHGDMPIERQAEAVRESRSGRRKVVLATNVAESSVTIVGVSTVIDSGLARIAVHSPWSGVQSLELCEVSQARAVQRAGRAGRMRAGVARRLYTRGNFAARPTQDAPEIEREELSAAVLLLASLGVTAQGALRFLTPPPRPAWDAAVELLRRLGALDGDRTTATGRRLLTFPLHPRLARVIVEGERRGIASEACLAAALLGERDLRLESRTRFAEGANHSGGESGDSDVTDMIDRFRWAESERFARHAVSSAGLDATTTRTVARTVQQLSRLAEDETPPQANTEAELTECLLRGFPDRVAQRRGNGNELVFAQGGTAELAPSSVVHRAPLLIALSTDRPGGQRRRALVRVACSVAPESLLDLDSDQLELSDEFELHLEKGVVEHVSSMRFGKLVLDESRRRAEPGPEPARLLAKAVSSKGLAWVDPEGVLSTLTVKVALLREHFPKLAAQSAPDELESEALIDKVLLTACEQCTSLNEVRRLDLAALASASLDADLARLVRTETPDRVFLPSGRELRVHYDPNKPPWVESRLQDFFSATQTPSICGGRIPLQLHLLAPNRRAVQVTTDLAGFWERHYAGIRKELKRRYPKHDWPEDGRTAPPPPPGRLSAPRSR